LAGTGLSFLLWRTPPRSAPRRIALVSLVTALLVLGAVVVASWERTRAPGTALPPVGPASAAGAGGAQDAGSDWLAYGGTQGGRRYSSLRQISTANVGNLEEAWTFQTGDLNPAEGRVFYAAQNTPIKAGDFLYTCTPSNQVYALDPATGE